jgi:ABC-type lipoprotein export system ATPase subunit
MTERDLFRYITTTPVGELMSRYPLASDFLSNIRLHSFPKELLLEELIDTMDTVIVDELGLIKEEIPYQLTRFLLTFYPEQEKNETGLITSLTILGGRNKAGEIEDTQITLRKGEVTAVVGPTGSGKSRLLADIECLAQRDTPTGRQILINGRAITENKRFDMDGKLVAQLSQNMNFVMDLTCHEFLEMHARSRLSDNVENTIALCMECANTLAGEKFGPDTKVTQLSGGQSRALMIADTAFMSSSPLVLIDEIENAGIDRKMAVNVLTRNDKIVLIATHDPLLALRAEKRIVIQNGGIYKVIETTPEEKAVLSEIEKLDDALFQIRRRLRAGELINGIKALPVDGSI